MKNKLILKKRSFLKEATCQELGVIGEETPIKDKNGTELKVGDLVFYKWGNFKKLFGTTVIIKFDEMSAPYGMLISFDKKGNKIDDDLTIEKIKGYEEIELGSAYGESVGILEPKYIYYGNLKTEEE